VLSMVGDIRRRHPRMGGKKLYQWIRPDIDQAGVRMGRDKFFELLGRHSLLVKRKRKYVSTTDSYHHFRVYRNLLRHQPLTRGNQAWVSDITYIRTVEDFAYLFLITDAYSRKIVGWHLSDSLKVSGAVAALKMAIKQCPVTREVIHHSDRGIQYCCKDYVALLNKAEMKISMTEENHCYENATAERINGILKQEYGLEATFATQQQAAKAVREAVWLYNTERPHWSLNMATPEHVHSVV